MDRASRNSGSTAGANVGYESIGHGFYLEDGTETGNQLYANLGVFARAAVANGLTPDQADPQNPRWCRDPHSYRSFSDSSSSTTSAASTDRLQRRRYQVSSRLQHPPILLRFLQSVGILIMNGMNDFQYNMAAGAATCGACYWFVPGAISGPSQSEKWYGYAGEQQMSAGMAGTTPLETYRQLLLHRHGGFRRGWRAQRVQRRK